MANNITKLEGYRNGYRVEVDETTEQKDLNEQLMNVYRKYKKLNCTICNEEMATHFRPATFMHHSTVVVNNKVPDNCFFINGFF